MLNDWISSTTRALSSSHSFGDRQGQWMFSCLVLLASSCINIVLWPKQNVSTLKWSHCLLKSTVLCVESPLEQRLDPYVFFSWATRSEAITGGFHKWGYPHENNIFSCVDTVDVDIHFPMACGRAMWPGGGVTSTCYQRGIKSVVLWTLLPPHPTPPHPTLPHPTPHHMYVYIYIYNYIYMYVYIIIINTNIYKIPKNAQAAGHGVGVQCLSYRPQGAQTAPASQRAWMAPPRWYPVWLSWEKIWKTCWILFVIQSSPWKNPILVAQIPLSHCSGIWCMVNGGEWWWYVVEQKTIWEWCIDCTAMVKQWKVIKNNWILLQTLNPTIFWHAWHVFYRCSACGSYPQAMLKSSRSHGRLTSKVVPLPGWISVCFLP